MGPALVRFDIIEASSKYAQYEPYVKYYIKIFAQTLNIKF